MHGLINRSFQRFLTESYGLQLWRSIADAAALPPSGFEALQIYDDRVTETVLREAMLLLDRPRETLLEDFGTFLVSHPTSEAIRRLLRFGGSTFSEFLLSLDELPDRAKLALSDLDLPNLDLQDHQGGSFTLICRWPFAGSGHVLTGVLRTMADDYGALVLLEHCGTHNGCEKISVELLQHDFSEGRSFDLAVRA